MEYLKSCRKPNYNTIRQAFIHFNFEIKNNTDDRCLLTRFVFYKGVKLFEINVLHLIIYSNKFSISLSLHEIDKIIFEKLDNTFLLKINFKNSKDNLNTLLNLKK